MDLATRWDRLGAVIFDFLIMIVPVSLVLWPIEFYLGMNFFGGDSFKAIFIHSIIFFATFLFVNGPMLKARGQTLGKRIVGIKISTIDGNVPVLFRQMIPRYVLFSFLYVIPKIGWALYFVNIIFVFRHDKRCVHDIVAKTIVVKC